MEGKITAVFLAFFLIFPLVLAQMELITNNGTSTDSGTHIMTNDDTASGTNTDTTDSKNTDMTTSDTTDTSSTNGTTTTSETETQENTSLNTTREKELARKRVNSLENVRRAVATKKWAVLNKDASVTMKITEEQAREVGVRSIKITVNTMATNVEINVNRLQERPAEVKEEPRGKVYRYIEINKTNVQNEEITQARLTFTVEKAWIEQNNIDENTVILSRYNNESWKDLPTTLLSENESYYLYEAETPGFSVFAIKGEVRFSEPEKVCVPGETTCYGREVLVCVNGTDWSTQEECWFACSEGECIEPAYENLWIVLAIAGAAVLVLVLWKFRHRLRRPAKIDSEKVYEKINRE